MLEALILGLQVLRESRGMRVLEAGENLRLLWVTKSCDL